MATCSITLKKDNLGTLINKTEFFLFRAAEQKGIDFNKLAKEGSKVSFVSDLLNTVRDSTIPSYINEYQEQAKLNKDAGDLESAEDYEKAIVNLQNMLVVWKQFVPNFIQYSSLFNIRTKFKLDEDGLVDLNDVADDEEKMLKKMVFDQPANEIDPTDEIDKSVELFIRSIPAESFDDYGFTSSVDYGNFVRNMYADLENSIGMDELISKLEKNKEKIPEYQYIIDKLTYTPGLTKDESRFRIAFRNSFVKAFIPIYQTSIEDGKVIKVFEAASGKKTLYERIIASNFALRGMSVVTKWKKVAETGEIIPDESSRINLASKIDGTWQLNKDSIQAIKDYLKPGVTLKLRQIEFLKGIGLKLSAETQAYLLKTNVVGEGKDKSGNYAQVPYISNHLITALENLKENGKIINPFKTIKNSIKIYNPTTKKTTTIKDQATSIGNIINEELKRNRGYNTERSMVNSNGDRVHAIQLHNNITLVNKYLSDPEAFPTLNDIIANEPSMFWLDPRINPAIRNDLFLNSLFFFDPKDENFGKRRRVKKDMSFSATEGEFVINNVMNTGGVQLKLISEFTKEGSNSTSLNEIDKLLQDINLFKNRKLNSMLRLSDKSTDLGMGLNYYYNPIINKAMRSPLGDGEASTNIFSTGEFIETIKGALQDVFEMKYLRSQGFLADMTRSSGNLLNTWSYFDGILSKRTKDLLNGLIKEIPNIEDTKIYLDAFSEEIEKDIEKYFKEYAESFYNKFNDVRNLGINDYGLINKANFKDTVYDYVANAFVTDLSQMKVFFGDAIFFKDFHKRASKDSATGIITFMDSQLLDELNDFGNTQGWGSNTNLSGRRFIERIYQKQLSEIEKTEAPEEEKQKQREKYKEERDRALMKQTVQKSFKSAVLNDVGFKSEQSKIIKDNIEYLKSKGFVSDEMYKIYNAEKGLSKIITDKYEGKEGDGQGYCTFDFYRIMSIATGKWDDEQEKVYNKIVEYNNYDELAEEETDPTKKAEYLQKRDAVGYNPTEAVYFPPKKFQYSGPQNYERMIGDTNYTTNVPVFDKFSLQPLIPTVIKKGNVKTAHWYLARKMEYNGVGYVKFESASKVETPKKMDNLYTGFDENKPSVRSINDFSKGDKFTSEQELYFNHLREQVAIDADIHESSIFGSQIRKIVVMNLTTKDAEGKILFPEFRTLYNNYKGFLEDLVKIEKANLYNELGIESKNGRLQVSDLKKTVDYFFKEISKKNQDTNVRKALKYDEKTGKFEIPLDATVQAQVIEGIIIAAINNKIVRYKTNGSMLIQTAITGSEAVKFNKDASAKALETYGNKELKYYEVEKGKDGKPTVTKMEVKISLTGQWLKLLELSHPNGGKVGSIERLNDLLKNNPEWVSKNEKSVTMISYRIPTAGRNFLDVMKVKEFLPASAGDVIIMPTEAIIKSGSDFDIDKMFTFYPNLRKDGTYAEGSYTEEDLNNPDKYNYLKGVVQNKVYETMGRIILHPANYMELVTPSENYHIMPVIDDIYKKLNPGQKEREKTDYKNTDILNREKNIRKFLSLLKGKADLGIAAIANTYNVLFQLSNAKANPEFLKNKAIKTFFTSEGIGKNSNDYMTSIDYSNVFDEDGMLKSEFFTEFITAFVDVAKDDYVFAVNVVTELSPIMFYMKNQGLSTSKILNFVNQPAIRFFSKRMMIYQNKFVKANGIALNESARSKAVADTLMQLGYYNKDGKTNRAAINDYILTKQKRLGIDNISEYFKADDLFSSIKPDGDLSKLSAKEKLIQIAMISEMENLKVQSNSMTEAQTALNFDTKPFTSTFDVNARNKTYEDGLNGSNILSPATLKNIKENSVISHLDVSNDIREILSNLLPVRNNKTLNDFLLAKFKELKDNAYGKNKAVRTQDDMLKFARTAKNDFIGYILQNFIGKSQEGKEFFESTFETDKDFNEYMKELVETSKLNDTLAKIQELPDFETLANSYPFIRNIVVEPGENNNAITTFKIVESGTNKVDKEKTISDFQELIDLDDSTPEKKMVRDFFRNLALYSTFQSGLNTSENSYTDVTPITLVNKLYGYAVEEYTKIAPVEQQKTQSAFYNQFIKNNPGFFNKRSNDTPTREASNKGKWYSEDVKLDFKPKPTPAPKQVMTPVNKQATVVRYNGTVATKDAARAKQGVYIMTPNEGDNLPGVDENYNFGNPWNHMGYQNKIKTDTIEEAVTNYEKWLRKEDFLDVEPERRDWILSVINAGRLDGKNLLYFASGFRSHADALADFINTRVKETTQVGEIFSKKNIIKVNPIQTADKKAIVKASVATQFIGFGEDIVGSSTELYRKQAGALSNTGNYSANDVIFVSVPGKRGDAAIAKREQDKTIKEAIKALEAGATILVDNKAYTEASTYNTGEQRLLKNLEVKGYQYSEITVDGQLIGTFKKVTTFAPTSTPVVKDVVEGVNNIPNTGLSVEQSNNFIDILQPQIHKQAYVENRATTANMMFSFGLRWAKNIPNSTEKSEQAKNLGQPRPNRKAIKSKEGMTYGYYLTDQNNNPLPSMKELKPIMNFIESKLGIDMSNYDAMLGNIYDNNSFIHQHRDTTESVTAEGYPVIVVNLGADGHLEYDKDLKSTYASYKKSGELNLTNGGIYAFGVDGKNRFTFHHRIGSGLESANPLKPITLPNGQVLKDYRITLTFRRASDLTKGMPASPVVKSITEQNKMPKKPFERTFVPPTRDAQGNVISKDKQQQPMAPPEVVAEQELKEKINEWIEKELPWSISTPASQIAEMYKKEKLSGETIEEYLNRLSCLGKLI